MRRHPVKADGLIKNGNSQTRVLGNKAKDMPILRRRYLVAIYRSNRFFVWPVFDIPFEHLVLKALLFIHRLGHIVKRDDAL